MTLTSLNTLTSSGLIGALAIIALLSFSALIPQQANARRRGGVDLTGTTPLEASFFKDLQAQRMSTWSQADAFFIASGIRQPQELERARAWLNDVVRRAEHALKGRRGVEERADHLLRWTHEQLFSRYHARSTDALEVIKYGRFNCLSSCVIYGLIAERLGMKVRGIAVERHAFCRVYESARRGARGWDVETTTPFGFNPGRDVQIDNAVISVPRSRYRGRREVTLVELIGLIYTNHMGLNAAFPSARDRLLAYQKAALFFARDPTIQHNVVAAYTQVINEAIDRQRWGEAWAHLEGLMALNFTAGVKARARTKDAQRYGALLCTQLADTHAHAEAQLSGDARALEVLKGYARACPQASGALSLSIADRQIRTARAFLSGRTTEHTRAQGVEGYARALKALKTALVNLERHPARDPQLKELIRVKRHNSLAAAHNLIIDALNAGQQALATRLIAVGRASLPRDQEFKRLERLIKR
jgi:hypothetical protein